MNVGISAVRGLKRGAKSKSRSKARDRSVRPTRDLTSKQRGELAEMMFMVKAAQKGFATAKPYGDSRRYDFIVDTGRRLWRVQVKSSSKLCKGAYHVSANRH